MNEKARKDMKEMPVVHWSETVPNRLLDAKEMAAHLTDRRMAVSPERLVELADQRLIPHFRVDGGPPVFQLRECTKWIWLNLAWYFDGRVTPPTYRIVVSGAEHPQPRDCPKSLWQIADKLVSIPAVCGVYFLCGGGEVVYVGQALNVGDRVAQHLNEKIKQFDHICALPLPAALLNEVEQALIIILRPKYNNTVLKGGAEQAHITLDRAICWKASSAISAT